jgi:hypothetical protein
MSEHVETQTGKTSLLTDGPLKYILATRNIMTSSISIKGCVTRIGLLYFFIQIKVQ